jgi:molecular chaperone GrpE
MENENNKELDAFTDSTENNDDKEDAPEIEKVKDSQEELLLCEDKLQRVLADYQNLERRSKMDVTQKVTLKVNQLMLDFIGIYEDFIRAKSALTDEGADTEGLLGVIKNMETILSENNIKEIEAIGEIFNPKLHDAVSTVEDNLLEEGTITQEVAKGYISFQEVIKPSKVIVSKKK